MDPWDDINPYASSSGSEYGNPVSNLGTPTGTNANQTSRCIRGQADKSSPRTLNHSLSNAFQEGELNSRSGQGQWGKTNNYVGGISCASTKNGMLHKKREQPSSKTAWCQWKNEEVPPSDAHRREESSSRSLWKNKYDFNSRNNVSPERGSGLPTGTHLECRRSLFDINYEAKTELQTRDYHSGRNHNNVAESNLKRGSKCDGLDYVDEIKSDYDNLPEIRLQERDHHDLRKYYDSDESDDDSSSEENYLVDIELAKRNMQLNKKYNCGLETQLRRRDDSLYKSHDVAVKTELDKSRDLVVVKTEVEEKPDFEETFDYTSETRWRKRDFSADWEYVMEPQPKKRNVESNKTHKHPNQRDDHFAWSRLLGARDDYSDSYLRNRDRHLEETNYSSHGYSNASQLEMKDNKKQPEKREESVGVRKALMSLVPGGAAQLIPQASKIQQPPGQLPQMDKKTRRRMRPFRMKLPSGATLQLKKSDAIALGLLKQKSEDVTPATDDHVTESRWYKRSKNPHGNSSGNSNDQLDRREDVSRTTDVNVTKSPLDQKDNQDKNCYDKSNINSWSLLEPLEKIKKVSYTTDNNTTESCWDKKDNHQETSYHDKNNIWSFLGQLERIKQGSYATDNDKSESRLDKKDIQDKSYHDENNTNIWSFLGRLGKIKEVSHTTDDNTTKSRWDQKYNHRDEKYDDENNRNKKDELEKRETVSHTADCVTKSHRDKKDNCQDKKYRDKNNSNKKDEPNKSEVSHTTDNCVTKSSQDNKDNQRNENYHDKNNRNKKDELEKRETVSHTADYVTKSHRDKKDNCQDKNDRNKNNRNREDGLDKRNKKDNRQDKNYRDKNISNKKEELDKKKVSHTTDDYATKSCRDNKDNHRDKNYDKDNRNKKDQREKREEVSHRTNDYATKYHRDKKDNCQDKNYRDKNNKIKKDELNKREVSQTNDDYVTKSNRDKKDNHRDKNYDKDNRNKKDQREKKEVSQRTDDHVTKSSQNKKDDQRDKNCHDKGKDTVQKGLKIDIFAIKRELEEKIRKARMIKNSPAQISDYSNLQSNPTAATLLGSRKCDSNGTPTMVTKTVSENQNNSDQQAVSLSQLHFNTVPKEDKAPPLISIYQNPNFFLPGSEKKPLVMTKDGFDFLQALGDKGNINYPYIFAGPDAQRKLEAQKAMERFLERIGMSNVINIVPFKSDCSITSLRENLRIVDSSDKYWTHLAGLCYHIVQSKERLLKTSTNINNQFDLVKEVQRNYSVLNAMILGKLDVADGPKHMQILRQWLQQSNANSTITGTIGFSFNYVFNYDSALQIDYEEVIKRFSNDRKLEISTMLHIGNDVCTAHGWMEHLKHHKSLYEAVIISNYSADSVEQFEKNYLQLKENAAKITFKHNSIYEISSKEESLIPNPDLQIVNSYVIEQQPSQGHNFPYVGQCNTTQYKHFATGEAAEVQPGLRPYLSGKRKWQGERNNMHMTEWRKQMVAPVNTPLQHQSPPANLLPFPHAQGIEPSQPPHGVDLASVALPCMSVPPPIMIPVVKNLDSFVLVPDTAYKLFEIAGYDFIGKLCEKTNLKIDLIKEQGVSTVQYICTLQGPDKEKLKAKAAIIKFCNGRDDVRSRNNK